MYVGIAKCLGPNRPIPIGRKEREIQFSMTLAAEDSSDVRPTRLSERCTGR